MNFKRRTDYDARPIWPESYTIMMTSEEMKLDHLRKNALETLKNAVTAWHEYAKELPVGDDRTEAFQVFENLRNSNRRW